MRPTRRQIFGLPAVAIPPLPRPADLGALLSEGRSWLGPGTYYLEGSAYTETDVRLAKGVHLVSRPLDGLDCPLYRP